jgi:uncharacterized phage protein (TIGR02216 family)
MGFGFAILRLSPDAFWRMTPRELAAAIRALAPSRASPLERSTFDALMRRFPDTTEFHHG